MLNISLQIVRNPPSHGPAPNVFVLGDIHNIHETESFCHWDGTKFVVTQGIGVQRMGFIHIQDVPISLTFEQIKMFLTDSYQGAVIDNVPTILAKRIWKLDTAQLSAAQLQALMDDGEITLMWAEVKPMIWHKVAARAITDGDI